MRKEAWTSTIAENKPFLLTQLKVLAVITLTLFLFSGCLEAHKQIPPPPQAGIPTTQTPRQQALSLYVDSEMNRQQGNISQAITDLQKAVILDNTSSFLWTTLATLYWEQGNITLAEESLGQALKQGGYNSEMFVLQGFIHLYKEEHPQAIGAFGRATTLNPKDVRAYEMLAAIHAKAGDFVLAIEALDKIIALEPEDINARLFRSRCFAAKRDFVRAVADLRVVIAYTPESELYKVLARLYRTQGDFGNEVAVYKEALSLFPDDCQIRQILAEMLTKEGDFVGAEGFLWKNATATVWCVELEEPLAVLYLKSGSYRRAIITIKSMIQGGNVERGYYFLGLAYEGINNSEMALKAYESVPASSLYSGAARLREAQILASGLQTAEAIKRVERILPAPKLPEAYLVLASLYDGQGDIARAEKILREALDIHKNNFDILYNLGFLLGKGGHHEGAVVVMRQILSIDANHTNALNFIGYSYAERGINLYEAQKLIEQALHQSPRSGPILDSMGWVLFKQKRYEEAEKYLEEARTLLPNEDLVAEHLAQTYEKMNKDKEAQEIYRHLLQKNPNDERLQKKAENKETKSDESARESKKSKKPKKQEKHRKAPKPTQKRPMPKLI